MKLTRFTGLAGIVLSTMAVVGLEGTARKLPLHGIREAPPTIAELKAESAALESRNALIRGKIAAKIWLIHDWLIGDLATEELVSRWIRVSADPPTYPQALRGHFPGLRDEEIALLQIASYFESFKELLEPKAWSERVEELAAHSAGP